VIFATVAAGLCDDDQAEEVCGLVGRLEKPACDCGAGTSRPRVASSDPVNQTVEVPRQRETALTDIISQLTVGGAVFVTLQPIRKI